MTRHRKKKEGAVWFASIELDLPPAAAMAIDVDWPDKLANPPTLGFNEGDTPEGSRLEIYCDGPPDAEALTALTQALSTATRVKIDSPSFEPLPDQDWVSMSQKLLQPVEAGRFVIFGGHDRERVDPAKTGIEIEAGQAFGTGQHESTKGCLLALDWLADRITPGAILDLGTGSGVLAMAAWHVWQAPVLATEIDDIATRTARENVAANNIPVREAGEGGSGIAPLTADGFDAPAFGDEGPFGLIMANILARPLIGLAPEIARHAATESWLVLSGLLQDQADEVRNAFKAAGFRFERDFRLGDWSTLVLQLVEDEKQIDG